MGYYPGVKLDEEFPYPERQQTGCYLGEEFREPQKAMVPAQLELPLRELLGSELTELVKLPLLPEQPLA
jgi:hypothetical protein